MCGAGYIDSYCVSGIKSTKLKVRVLVPRSSDDSIMQTITVPGPGLLSRVINTSGKPLHKLSDLAACFILRQHMPNRVSGEQEGGREKLEFSLVLRYRFPSRTSSSRGILVPMFHSKYASIGRSRPRPHCIALSASGFYVEPRSVTYCRNGGTRLL